jgi:replicative DNA helicase
MIHQFNSRDKRAQQQTSFKTPALSEMLPNSLDAEQNVLGLLLNGAPIHLVSDLVHADDFWKDEHRMIYQAMLLLAEQRQPIEVIMISENLRSQNILIEDEVGGYLYLSKLSRQAYEQIQGHSALENHAQMIADKALARRGLAACQELAQVFYRENAQVALSLAQNRFAELFTANAYADFLPLNDFADETIEQITDLQDRGGGLVGIPCGFHGLDAMTNGLLKAGKLIIFGGRTGHGKTSWVLSVIHHIASKQEARVGILSLEMSRSELFKRQISLDARIDSLRMSSGRMTPDEYARFRDSAERLRTYPIFIDDTFGCDISDLEAKAYRLHAKHGLDVLVVDYLQLLDAEKEKDQGEVARLTAISRGLKGLARRLNIPVVALVQVNRTVESKVSHIPSLADIRGSGSIEQDADMVLFLYRDEMYNEDTERKGQADIIVAKHREGPQGTDVLGFEASCTRFFNLCSEEEAERYGH